MGAYGLEASYDDVLSGSTGLTITPTNVNGTPLLFSGGEQMFDAENGSSLVLTLDTNVQYALEKGLESMLVKYDAANGGSGVGLALCADIAAAFGAKLEFTSTVGEGTTVARTLPKEVYALEEADD